MFGPCLTDDSLFKENGTVRCMLDNCTSLFDPSACQESGCTWKGRPEAASRRRTHPASCDAITDQSDCTEALCTWTGTDGPCGPASQSAYELMPVCVDSTPASCINNKCTAMMCGYSGLKPGPPPGSSDWNASSPNAATNTVAKKDVEVPNINLQGTSCTFQTMNQGLSNKVQNAKGSLWVNSFRFGVGQSFSDYEQARNFFPPSDAFCSTSPTGYIDRFTNYINPAEWCDGTSSVFLCSKNGFMATDQGVCLLYCEDDTTDCQPETGQGFICSKNGHLGLSMADCIANCDSAADCSQSPSIAYQCHSSQFAYSNVTDCQKNCARVSDSTSCTNNITTYPFLGAGADYQSKYVADYMVDAWDTGNSNDWFDVCRTKTISSSGASEFNVSYWDQAPPSQRARRRTTASRPTFSATIITTEACLTMSLPRPSTARGTTTATRACPSTGA